MAKNLNLSRSYLITTVLKCISEKYDFVLQCNDAIHRDYPFKCTIGTTRAYRINCTQTGYLLQEKFLVGFLDSHFSTRIGKVLDSFLVHRV